MTARNGADIANADVEFRGVSKAFGEVLAVDDVSFSIARGSFHSFLGPSGCGKTTSLRLIAGFEAPTGGAVLIAGAAVNGVPSFRRPVNMVFQHYALFPHLSVTDNIAYGLRQRRPRPDKAEIARRVDEMLETVRLEGYGRRRVWELSGGQQQRVALARALINRPTVLLLDEPLAALDRKLRREVRMELQTLQREVGITFVFVTHDQEEALSMSDTIAVMRQGRIVQMGSPTALYDAPVNRYVADFVGESNFFTGEVVETVAGGAAIRCGGDLVVEAPYSRADTTLAGKRQGVIALRPERLAILAADGADARLDYRLAGRVQNRIYLGEFAEYGILTEILGKVLVRANKTAEAESGGHAVGDAVVIGWRRNAAVVLRDD